MNQDQGKPSKRLYPHGHFRDQSVTYEMILDELHQRLVSAEAEIKELREHGSNLFISNCTSHQEMNERLRKLESPTQEATKPVCQHNYFADLAGSNGEKQICTSCYIVRSKPIPTPEPRKLAEVIGKVFTNRGYVNAPDLFELQAEAAVKEVERVIDEYWDGIKVGSEWGFDSLKKYIREKLL